MQLHVRPDPRRAAVEGKFSFWIAPAVPVVGQAVEAVESVHDAIGKMARDEIDRAAPIDPELYEMTGGRHQPQSVLEYFLPGIISDRLGHICLNVIGGLGQRTALH